MTFDIDEEHLKLANMKLPELTKVQKENLENLKKNLLNEIIDKQNKFKYNSNKDNCTIGWFYQNHKGKIYLRGFMIAYEMDFRLKNPIKNEYLYECYRQVEDLERPVVRGCFDVYNSYNWCHELRYAPNDKWHTQRGTNTMLNYGCVLTNEEELKEIINKHDVLKYAQDTLKEKESLVTLLKKLKKYPALELVRKCGFTKLEEERRALSFLSSNSKKCKSFKKFLFKMYSVGKVKESYGYYKWYYDKYKFDIRDLEYRDVVYFISSNFNFKKGELQYQTKIEWKATPEELAKMLFKSKGDTDKRWYYGLWIVYIDYLKMSARAGHNINDRYWQLPKNITKAHDKVLKEIKVLEDLEEAERLGKKQKRLTKAVAKYQQFNAKINGYDIFVPNDYAVIKPHVEALHQCILAAKYDDKMIEGRSILIFVQKDKTPIASVEIDKGKKILQAYANEINRNNCMPTEEVMEAVNEYLLAFNPNVKEETKTRRIINDKSIRDIIPIV